MRNLSLSSVKSFLSRNEMRVINGGGNGTCAYQSSHGFVVIEADITTAQQGAADSGGHWCCDSCCGASWTQGYGC